MFLHRALDDKAYKPDKKMADFAKKIRPQIMNKTGLSPEESMKGDFKTIYGENVKRADR